MKNKLSLILQLIGIALFIAGNFTGRSNLLPFLVGCLTGLRPDQQQRYLKWRKFMCIALLEMEVIASEGALLLPPVVTDKICNRKL